MKNVISFLLLLCQFQSFGQDTLPPVLHCKTNFTTIVSPTCLQTIWITEVVDSVSDNATPDSLIELSCRRKGFVAADTFPTYGQGNLVPGATFRPYDELIYGDHFIETWARDKAGNTSKCLTSIILEDPWECHPPNKVGLNICTRTWKNQPISQTFIEIKTTHPSLPSLNYFFETSDDGCNWPVQVPLNADCKITPTSPNQVWLNGVTTYDLLLISRHILGVAPLPSPYQILAADANRSGSVTTNDIVVLRKLILGITDSIAGSTCWRFVPADFQFQNFTVPIPESVDLKVIAAPATVNFIGMKTGDVNGNALSLDASDDRAPHTFFIENQKLRSGEEYILPVGGGGQNALAGFQIGLKIDPAAAQLEQVLPGAAAGFSAENFAASPDGSLAISWFDALKNAAATDPAEPLFFLKIKALRDARLSEILKMDDSRLVPEAIETDAAAPRRLDLQFFEKNEAVAGFRIFPNPAANLVEVLNLDDVSAATDAPAFFEIFDALGRPVRRGEFAGRQSRLDLQGLPAGQFLLKILSGREIFTQILIKN